MCLPAYGSLAWLYESDAYHSLAAPAAYGKPPFVLCPCSGMRLVFSMALKVRRNATLRTSFVMRLVFSMVQKNLSRLIVITSLHF